MTPFTDTALFKVSTDIASAANSTLQSCCHETFVCSQSLNKGYLNIKEAASDISITYADLFLHTQRGPSKE